MLDKKQQHRIRQSPASLHRPKTHEVGFSLIEIIIVIALIGFVFSIALPNLTLKTGTEVASRLGRLNEDVRAAYDYSILNGRAARLVFKLYTGKYHLEVADRANIYLGNSKVASDPMKFEEDDAREQFESDFEEYTDLAEQSYQSEDSDEEIVTSSPVLKAKDKLMGARWHKHTSTEWTSRSMGEALAIRSIRAEHHARAITVEEVGEEARAYIYFLPSGYVEKAVIYIYYKLDGYSFDMEANPYRLVTQPHLGEARIGVVAKETVDLNRLDYDDEDDA